MPIQEALISWLMNPTFIRFPIYAKNMSKGTILLTPFPYTDLSGSKVRPALVLYNQKGGEDFIVAFISSIPQKKSGIFEILISPTQENGLKRDSIIKLSKIATL